MVVLSALLLLSPYRTFGGALPRKMLRCAHQQSQRRHDNEQIRSAICVIILCRHPAFVKINVSRVMLGNLVCELSSIVFYHDVSCLSSKGHMVELATSIFFNLYKATKHLLGSCVHLLYHQKIVKKL